jgi:8-amino-7-oxononanoate synthase
VRAARGAEAERSRLRQLSAAFRAELERRAIPVVRGSHGPIVPVVLGSSERALGAMERLRREGILAQAIRAPSVPEGTARLRLTVHADWPSDAPARVASAVERACAS